MFTGIIEEVGRVVAAGSGRLGIAAKQVLQGLEPGGSMAVNGACLTVTSFDSQSFSVDVSEETLKRTNLGLLNPGVLVNLERPLVLGKPLGGHLVQGHVDGTGRLAGIIQKTGGAMFRFEAPPEIMRYLVEKGFISVDGISLTITDLDSSSFQVAVVDFTERNTILGNRQIGDPVNLEIDIIAKYVERLHKAGRTEITTDYLREHGFSAG